MNTFSMISGLQSHIEVIHLLEKQISVLEDIARITIRSLTSGGCLYIAGNGGSAADAQHIAAEFVGRFKIDRKPLKAVALTVDTSIITAVSNDYSFTDIYSRQVKAYMTSNDVLWAISTSGNSLNILKAVEAANNINALVCGFTGENGKLSELCDHVIKVDHRSSDRIQEAHLLCYHLICELVERSLCGRDL